MNRYTIEELQWYIKLIQASSHNNMTQLHMELKNKVKGGRCPSAKTLRKWRRKYLYNSIWKTSTAKQKQQQQKKPNRQEKAPLFMNQLNAQLCALEQIAKVHPTDSLEKLLSCDSYKDLVKNETVKDMKQPNEN